MTTFDVYLNERRELLVVRRGARLPNGTGKWRKRRIAAVTRVSTEISSSVETYGYYLRKVVRHKTTNELAEKYSRA
jgi:hypothetical protein